MNPESESPSAALPEAPTPEAAAPAGAVDAEALPTRGTAARGLAWARWPFWNTGERRPRALLRLVVMGLFVGVLGQLTRALLRAFHVAPNSTWDDAQRFALGAAVVALCGLAGVALSARLVDRRRLGDYGLQWTTPAWWADFAFGLGLGALLMTLVDGIEHAAGWTTRTPLLQGAPPGQVLRALGVPAFLFFCVGVYEELFTRGYALRVIAEGLCSRWLSPRAAVAWSTGATSVAFGLVHLSNPEASLVSTLGITAAGLMLAAAYITTGRLALPIGLHITWNFFQGPIYGFPVSGLSLEPGYRRVDLAQSGPALWTGGAFGPEAGLMGVLAALLGLLLTLAWVRWREGRVSLWAGLAAGPPRRA